MEKNNPITRIFVSDIQPILPAIAGGRLRLAGLWGNVTDDFELTYVGTFDVPNQVKTVKKLGENGTEILVPCSQEHFLRMTNDNSAFPDLTLFDIAFHRYAHFSEEYIYESVRHIQQADIVVFSHPWSYPILKKFIDFEKQYLVYDSQNVESFLRGETLLLPQYGSAGSKLLQEILQIEGELSNDADMVLACSKRDSEQFTSLYGIAQEKIKIAPNGVFVKEPMKKLSPLKIKRMKKKWGLSKEYTVIFSGSNFAPNIQALYYINKIASDFLNVDFVITGNMNNLVLPKDLAHNLHFVGLLSDKELRELYQMADLGLNPMNAGSGSNVKVFTYMEGGLPVLSTFFGARGLDVVEHGFYDGAEVIALASLEGFSNELRALLMDPLRRQRIAQQSYLMIKNHYNWKEISREVCRTLKFKFQL